MRRIFILWGLATSILSSCAGESFESRFYARPRSQWTKNFQALPIDKQWSVYLYGVKTREPPPFDLAIVLAKKRTSILPDIVNTVEKSDQETDLESASFVMQMMREVVKFDYCTYGPIKDPKFQEIFVKKISDGYKYSCK